MNQFDTNKQHQAKDIQKDAAKATQMVEQQPSRVPSGAYIALAIGSIVASAGFMIAGKKQVANFIGQWAPTLLILGVYSKVSQLGNVSGQQRGSQSSY